MELEKLNNCPNCGGILDEAGRCKFCGSKVYDFLNISFDDPRSPSYAKTYIRIKVGNRIGILPVYPQTANYTMRSNSYYADNFDGKTITFKTRRLDAELDVNFRVLDEVIWYEEADNETDN